jgi:5-(carboxyamino)imidazole ribonucleotide synthase
MNVLSKKIGIIGGGQLGKMMILDAKRLGFYCITLDPSNDCPSHSISDEHIQAAFDDRDAIRQLAERSDVVTYEFEHIDAEFLDILEDEGYTIYPSPKSLLLIQDKLLQKNTLKEANIPVPDYVQVENIIELENAVNKFGGAAMLKVRRGGYDGKGNALISSIDAVHEAYEQLGSGQIPLMVERLVPFEKEVSVLACRGIQGQISIYPVGENHHKNSILDETLVPAKISKKAYEESLNIAEKVLDVFHGVGMFCIELFVTKDQEVLVNEVAPRPHNSGHYTIEGCVTSQFEQHVRAITGLPFGSSHLRLPSVMKNLLGEDEYIGKTLVEGICQAYQDADVKVHMYGKTMTTPFRKMGHLTVCASDVDEALSKARQAYDKIKIKGEDKA